MNFIIIAHTYSPIVEVEATSQPGPLWKYAALESVSDRASLSNTTISVLGKSNIFCINKSMSFLDGLYWLQRILDRCDLCL